MKNRLTLVLFILCGLGYGAAGQTRPVARQMAKAGEEVHVWAYPVKADKRKQYEHFVHDIFWPGARKLPAREQQVFRQTRVMHPVKANADGSYTYLFIMDPMVKGGDYDIESLIKKMYGAKQGGGVLQTISGGCNGKGRRLYYDTIGRLIPLHSVSLERPTLRDRLPGRVVDSAPVPAVGHLKWWLICRSRVAITRATG